jgi:hypothetical protein
MANPLLIAAAGVKLAGSVFSFLESKKQREKEKQAQAAAAKATAQAKKELNINYLKQLGIAKEAYEFEREALLSQGATATAAGVAGDPRGAAATAGRVGMLLAQQAKEQRAAMAKEMAAFNEAIAREDARLATARATIDLGEAAGAQAAAQDAAMMAQYNIQQGISGATSGLSDLFTSGAFEGRPEARAERALQRELSRPSTQQVIEQANVGANLSQQLQQSLENSSNILYNPVIPTSGTLPYTSGLPAGVMSQYYNPYDPESFTYSLSGRN